MTGRPKSSYLGRRVLYIVVVTVVCEAVAHANIPELSVVGKIQHLVAWAMANGKSLSEALGQVFKVALLVVCKIRGVGVRSGGCCV